MQLYPHYYTHRMRTADPALLLGGDAAAIFERAVPHILSVHTCSMGHHMDAGSRLKARGMSSTIEGFREVHGQLQN